MEQEEEENIRDDVIDADAFALSVSTQGRWGLSPGYAHRVGVPLWRLQFGGVISGVVMYIVNLQGGGGISWRPSAYSLLMNCCRIHLLVISPQSVFLHQLLSLLVSKLKCTAVAWTLDVGICCAECSMCHVEYNGSLSILKIIGKEFQKIVLRRYLERSIQKKFFSNLHSLQIKTIFQEKSSICENLLSQYMWFISMIVTSLIGANCECL